MPFKLYTRAEFRDSIRRKLGIVPPIDISMSNPAGAQPTNSPYPTNMQINDALTDAIRDINRTCGFHVQTFIVPVDGVTSPIYGEFGMQLSTFQPNTGSQSDYSPPGFLNDVLRVLWYSDNASPPQIVQPGYRDDFDRSGTFNYWAMLPQAQPLRWYIEGYRIFIMPAQNESGKYHFTCGTGIADFDCDDGVIPQIPIDYQNIFEYAAIVNLSMTQTMDVEAQTRAQMFAPKAADGIQRFKEWKLGGTGAPEPTMAFRSYRGGYGLRRTVR